jgi:hypothetical protein
MVQGRWLIERMGLCACTLYTAMPYNVYRRNDGRLMKSIQMVEA